MFTVKETAVLTFAAWAGRSAWASDLLTGGLAVTIPPVLLFTSFLMHTRGLLDAVRGPLLTTSTDGTRFLPIPTATF